MLLHLRRASRAAVRARLFSFSGGTLAGGDGGGVPSRFSRIHLPRRTGEVRLAFEVTVRMLPCPSSPRRASSCTGDAAEVAAVDVRDPVVLRQPLVDERIVRRQQIEHAAILADDAVEEQFGLALESPARRSSSKSGNSSTNGATLLGCADTATARRSCRRAICARESASMRRTCCSSTAGLAQPPLARGIAAARRPECCSTGRRTAARRARRR